MTIAPMLSFDLLKTEGLARRGRLTLNYGVVETLVFMPRYLVWAVGRESDGGLRVVLSLYWLGWLTWAWAA